MSAHNVVRKKVRAETNKVCCPEIYYQVLYDKNNDFATGQQTDSKRYLQNSKVTVLGKGTMNNIGFSFVSWNTKPNGDGTTYAVGTTFRIRANTTLYAQWIL